MKQYKIVGSDLDGTLLNDAMTVSYENKVAIEELSNRGVHVVPVTGRGLCEMPEVASIPNIRYIITSNGAVVFDKETKESIYLCISREAAKFIFDTLNEYVHFNVVHHDGKTYANNRDNLEICNVCPAVKKLVAECAQKEADFEEKLRLADNIESMSVFFENLSDMEECKKTLRQNPDLYVVDAWPYNIEIFSIDAGKDKALNKLAEKLDIKKEEIIAVGDSGNDIEMIKYAGLGLAASNACTELKNVADKVICSNNEHVVKYILTEFCD